MWRRVGPQSQGMGVLCAPLVHVLLLQALPSTHTRSFRRVVSGEELVFRVTVPDGIQRVHVLVDVCGSDILPFGVHPYVGLNTYDSSVTSL
jgi:hypothetical protein